MIFGLPLSRGSIIECERGTYRLLRQIREAGMGIVWEAESTDGKRHLIVKEPQVKNGDRRIAVERLIFESVVLRSINDEMSRQRSDSYEQLIRQHVVRYVDRSNTPATPLLILEFVDGKSMADMLRDNPIAENLAVQYTASLLKVVAALHLRGIIHRDISPTNIILNPKRGLVLIDFGTCQVLQPISGAPPPRYGTVILKRGFSAPELLRGLSDERSDIFSAAATLFYMLMGKSPDFSNSKSLAKNIHALNKKVSKTVSAIVEKAMSPNPEQRFQSAIAMLAAIDETSAKGPRIIMGDFTFELKPGSIDIGREHACDSSCKSLGFKHPPQIRIADSQNFIERHHVRIWLESDERCFIEDMKSVNHTAVKSVTGRVQILNAFEKVELCENDIVALGYSTVRGPYSTFRFRNT